MRTILAFTLMLFAVLAGHGSTPSDSVRIYFRLGYSSFDPSFDNNREAMATFTANVRKAMEADDIDSVAVRAYASPDGTSRANIRLAQRRCTTIKDLIEKETGLSPELILPSPGGIAWDELRRLVAMNPDVPCQAAVLDILDNTPVWEYNSAGQVIGGRKKSLMDLAGGRPYRWMYVNIFPELRNGVAVVMYRKSHAAEEPENIVEVEVEADESETITVVPEISDSSDNSNPSDFSEVPAVTLSPDHRFALKTNLLMDACLMPNLELEWMIKPRWSAAVEGGIAWWYSGMRSYRLAFADVEARYRVIDKGPWHGLYVGPFVGGIFYDLQNEGPGYKGEGGMAGASVGYIWPISRNFSLEAGIGAGYLYTRYKRYEPFEGHKVYIRTATLNYFGPLKLKFSVVWRFGDRNKHKIKSEI